MTLDFLIFERICYVASAGGVATKWISAAQLCLLETLEAYEARRRRNLQR